MIDAKNKGFKELNNIIKKSINSESVEIINVDGQRYIGAGLKQGKIKIKGVAGNDLGLFMDGCSITVEGDAQDGVGNTMNSGNITINGRAEDVVGYAMRGGSILVKDNAGYRVGVAMKSFEDQIPIIVIGGSVKDFLGEYMAGGRIVILGEAGNFIGTGMHGGIILIKGKIEESQLGYGAVIEKMTDWDYEELKRCLNPFCEEFKTNIDKILSSEFTKIVPKSHRPYGEKYC